MRISTSRCLLLSVLAGAAAVLCGCSSASAVRVRPWERATLADDAMNPERDGLGSAMMDHVNFSREAASGGPGRKEVAAGAAATRRPREARPNLSRLISLSTTKLEPTKKAS